MRIRDIRREYNLVGLSRSDLAADPIVQFKTWFEQAAGARRSGRVRKFLIHCYKLAFGLARSESVDVNASVLATADKDGKPSARVVLLKDVDERGFFFFSNYESRKGRELAENPCASLVFYWADQERQVSISGDVAKVSREESEAYFKTRPRASCLAAWVSRQSEPVESRAVLQKELLELESKFSGAEIPTPPNWGGYVLSPTRIEFWQGRPGRLHDRFCYEKLADESWRVERLCP